MKTRFIMFQRRGFFYCEDTDSGKQISLRTREKKEATILLNAKNESVRQPVLNLQIARTYLSAGDPVMLTRTWQVPMDEMGKSKRGSTLVRHTRAMKDKAFDLIRDKPILETDASQLLKVIESGTVATNVFLRRLHNFAVDLNWLPWPILPKKRWPKIHFGIKRAVTRNEHERIIGSENNPERKAFYEMCWHLGASQSDVAKLEASDVQWETATISFNRLKTGTVSIVRFDTEVESLLRTLPAFGHLFPKLYNMRESHRATEFKRCCRRLGISGITLHSYRYSWAERARKVGYPERFAMENLGHNSKAVHRAYARNVQVEIPSLQSFETQPKGLFRPRLIAMENAANVQ